MTNGSGHGSTPPKTTESKQEATSAATENRPSQAEAVTEKSQRS